MKNRTLLDVLNAIENIAKKYPDVYEEMTSDLLEAGEIVGDLIVLVDNIEKEMEWTKNAHTNR